MGARHVLWLGLAVFGFASSASAEEAAPIEQAAPEPAVEQSSSVRFDRLSFRLSSWPLQSEFSQWQNPGFYDKSYSLDLVNLEVSAVFGGGWTVEASSTILAVETIEPSITLRGGYSFAMSGGGEGALRSTYVVPLLGYRFARRPEQDDGSNIVQRTQSVQVGLAFDLFVGRRTGFSMRLFGAYEYVFINRTGFLRSSLPIRHTVQYGILIGFGFRQLGD